MRICRIIQHLLQLEGRDFVTEAYREFLKREPDPGAEYHVQLLAHGTPKIQVLIGIIQSEEAVLLYRGLLQR